MQKIAIIVAGGKGLRMGHDLPKQFLPIGGKPVLMHTLEAFHNADSTLRIILVLPEAQQSYWTELCKKYAFAVKHELANGGETRFHSVKNGILHANLQSTGKAIVGIHDGVRPFVSAEVICDCFRLAEQEKAVIPVVEVHETIRQLDENGSHTVDRSAFRLVQTPQVFQSDILLKAYEQPYTELFTDDASVVESAGFIIQLTNGNRENIKITTPFDITIAETLLSAR